MNGIGSERKLSVGVCLALVFAVVFFSGLTANERLARWFPAKQLAETISAFDAKSADSRSGLAASKVAVSDSGKIKTGNTALRSAGGTGGAGGFLSAAGLVPNLNDYTDELRALVNVDSGTSTIDGVARVAKIMSDKYSAMGWSVETVNLSDKVGPGVFATNKPSAQNFDVLLIGHMDTVFPEGTAATRPFSVDGAVARGPGVADMKSGLLSIVYALRTLDKTTADRLAIGVMMNPDEEIGSPYSKAWIAQYAKRSRNVLVFESARTDGSLVKARKGVSSYQIDIKGVAAHAGNDPLKGRSAVVELAYWIQALTKLNDYSAGTTLNVGTIVGGTARNVVPEYASASLDIRYWKISEFEKIEQTLLAMQGKPFTPDVSIVLTQKSFRPSMEVSSATEGLMKTVDEAGLKTGFTVNWVSAGGGSDASNTASLGIPSLDGFGPIGGSAHSPNEFLRLDSVIQRIEFVQNVLRGL